MGLFNFWKKKSKNGEMRIIKTIRGKKALQKSNKLKHKIIIRNVEPFQTVSGKYCIVKNKKTGRTQNLYDFRDPRLGFGDDYEIVTDWTYKYVNHEFPNEAAYVIPDDIQEGEVVFIKDLIENLIGHTYNQGGNSRLVSCKARWVNDDLKILYDPDRDVIRIVG